MRRLRRNVLAFAVLIAAGVQAQPITTAFTYQGEVRLSGSPATGLVDLRFRVYDALTGGTQQGPQLCVDNVALAAGRFTTQLDFGAVFTGAQRFLEIDVRSDTGLDCGSSAGFTTLGPRQPLTATPYATFAGSAGTAATAASAGTATNATQLNGQPPAFYQNAANLTAGTIPSARLAGTYASAVTLNNAGNSFVGSGAGLTGLNASNLATGTVSDSLLSANIPRLNSANLFTGPNTFSTDVGIGTPASGANLLVQGGSPGGIVFQVLGRHGAGVDLEGGLGDAESPGGAITITSGQSGGTSTSVGIPGANTMIVGGKGGPIAFGGTPARGGDLVLQGGEGGNGGTFGGQGGNVIILPGLPGTGAFPGGVGGLVGIGTALPTRLLHVQEGAANIGNPFSSTIAVESSSQAVIGFLSPPTAASGLRFGDNFGADAFLFFNTAAAPRGFQFGTSGGNATLTFTLAGDLGVGVATPEGRLHVQDGSAGTVTANAASVGVFERSAAAYVSILAPAANEAGILFGSPTNSADGVIMYNSSGTARGLQFRTGGNTTRAVITSAGDMGIGTTTPTTRLTVSGNANVTGTLSKGGGSFKIDHPLDPENKYLYHSFVESPDMMNVYNGNVVTDGRGLATITLPEWFEALNRDFRYQLTIIDERPDLPDFVAARIARKIAKNQFTIRTTVPGVEVSWQVTGIRKDPFAEHNRIPVEQEKPSWAKGRYLHPEAWGKPPGAGELTAPAAATGEDHE